MSITTDWKGYIIKEGDEICVIRVNHRLFYTNFVWVWQGKSIPIDIAQDPEGPCWRVLATHIVESGLTYKIKLGDCTYISPVSHLKIWYNEDIIIAIKGVSDKEEDYRAFINSKKD